MEYGAGPRLAEGLVLWPAARRKPDLVREEGVGRGESEASRVLPCLLAALEAGVDLGERFADCKVTYSLYSCALFILREG